MKSELNPSFFSKKKNVFLIALVYTFLWGSAFPLVKLCMSEFGIADGEETSKCLVAGIRFIISGAVLLLISAVNRKKAEGSAPPTKKAVLSALLYGTLSTTVQYAFTYIGLSHVDGSKGAVYDQMCVFLTVIVGGLLLKDDKLTWRKGLGCLVGFAGILAVSAESIGDALSFSFALNGEGMMLCAAACQTGAYLLAKKTADSIPAILFVGIGQFFGGVFLTGGSLAFGGKLGGVSVLGVLILLALVGISAAAYVLSLLPLRYFPASEVASFNLLIPVFGAIMSGLLLGENVLRLKYPLAIALIGIGILLIYRTAKEKETDGHR